MLDGGNISSSTHPAPHTGAIPDTVEDDHEARSRFKQAFSQASDEAIDLMIHLLHFNPHKAR